MSEAERDALDDQHNQSQGLNLKGKQTLSRNRHASEDFLHSFFSKLSLTMTMFTRSKNSSHMSCKID